MLSWHSRTVLQNYIPQDKLTEVKRVLYGANQGGPVQKLELDQQTLQTAQEADFDLQAYRFRARQEQNRKPRKVKVGLLQNSIKAPTTAPYAEQTQVQHKLRPSWSCLLILRLFCHACLQLLAVVLCY